MYNTKGSFFFGDALGIYICSFNLRTIDWIHIYFNSSLGGGFFFFFFQERFGGNADLIVCSRKFWREVVSQPAKAF